MVNWFGGARPFCGCFGAPPAVDGVPSSPTVTNARRVSEPPSAPVSNLTANQNPGLHPAAEAHKNGSLAISFSGGGFLLPYFIGVADMLIQLGVLRVGGARKPESSPSPGANSSPSSNQVQGSSPGVTTSFNPAASQDPTPTSPAPTPLAGSSAGSLIAASLACGLSPARILESFLESVEDCRTKGSYRRLEEVLLRQLQSSLPPDAAERCTGVATVSVTHLFPRPRTRLVSSFASREDLIRALLVSCHIPTYFNGQLTTNFRGKRAVDGGVTALLPRPIAPHDFLLKVCCFPRQHVARLPIFNRARVLHQMHLGITPDAFGPWPYTFRYMLAAALHPRSYRFIRKLLDAGRSDAGRWAVAAGIAGPDQLQTLTPLSLPLVLMQPAAEQPEDGVPGAPRVRKRLGPRSRVPFATGMVLSDGEGQQDQQQQVQQVGAAQAEAEVLLEVEEAQLLDVEPLTTVGPPLVPVVVSTAAPATHSGSA